MEYMTAEIFTLIAIAAIVAFLIIGFIKKTAWMCIIAVVIAIFLGVTNPDFIADAKETIVSVFDGGIAPLEDDDYSDMIGEEVDERDPNHNFGDIG
jgi:hypothetical protein